MPFCGPCRLAPAICCASHRKHKKAQRNHKSRSVPTANSPYVFFVTFGFLWQSFFDADGLEIMSSMANRLQNQVAWVSGAASGIGEAVARLFAQEGAAVALADVQTERGRAIVNEIRA